MAYHMKCIETKSLFRKSTMSESTSFGSTMASTTFTDVSSVLAKLREMETTNYTSTVATTMFATSTTNVTSQVESTISSFTKESTSFALDCSGIDYFNSGIYYFCRI